MMNHFGRDKKVLIVGLGLIGGSYAEALSSDGYEIGCIVRRQETLDYALNKGIVRHGRCFVDEDYVKQFDLIVLALYPKLLVDWVREYQHCFKQGALITDVAGVKSALVPAVQSILREDLEFVPAHPMAGREVYGVENCDCSIFRNANFLLTPTERNTEEAVMLVEEMAKILGFKKISRLSPEAHDEMIAFLSQLTHCIAVTLMTSKASEHLVDYTGDSFRDLTRIARINENMWTELFLENKQQLLSQMDLFMEQFSRLRSALEEEDEKTMKDMMRLSTHRRAYFDKEKQ